MKDRGIHEIQYPTRADAQCAVLACLATGLGPCAKVERRHSLDRANYKLYPVGLQHDGRIDSGGSVVRAGL